MRIKLGMRGQKRKASDTVRVLRLDDDGRLWRVNEKADAVPALLPMFVLETPGLRLGLPPATKTRFWLSLHTHDDEMLSKVTRDKTGYHIPLFSFVRMVAKTAHADAVATFGLGSFEPLLCDLIRGRTEQWTHLIGGAFDPVPPKEDVPHVVRFHREAIAHQTYIVATVRFFAMLGAPAYEVFTGRLPARAAPDSA